MKKKIATILAAALCIATLVGCGNGSAMRANKTAATYNNYILENSFVWSGNVPADIRGELPYLE